MSSTKNNEFRLFEVKNKQSYRSNYRRDYARVIHSPAFRRLEHKTQLFPGTESDLFRNRLTHSLEVAQIAKTIAYKLYKEQVKKGIPLPVIPDVCEIAGLMHDLGHPPFGHNGEAALDSCMLKYGGFEGNAQTLRIITRLEKKEYVGNEPIENGIDNRKGLNLTARVIASTLKYDKIIPISRNPPNIKLVKGYFNSEKDIVAEIKNKLNPQNITPFKTVECSIMDLADDIAYSTFDMEDAFKAGFLTPYEIMAVDETILEQIVTKLADDPDDPMMLSIEECRYHLYNLFAETWDFYLSKIPDKGDPLYTQKLLSVFMSSYNLSKKIASTGYMRTEFTSILINSFINGIEVEMNMNNPILSKVYFNKEIKIKVNILKHFSYVCLINSPRLKVVENRGFEFIHRIFERLAASDGYKLLPEDYQNIYFSFADDIDRMRVIADFIAGMTDRYAIEFYARLFSENPQTIFRPL